MTDSNFNPTEERKFIYQESIDKAPKKPVSEPIVETRELLLKAQVLLGQYEKEEQLNEKEDLRIHYGFIKELYLTLMYGGLN
jgi:hypothetical protein